ncbi:MAG: putative serine/threonine-protein kinase iks1 [Vezdaea aestivalis]|nr:MAG: putative serine/threonine-protein kinase iks1 [Vezdaea aestivalis]
MSARRFDPPQGSTNNFVRDQSKSNRQVGKGPNQSADSKTSVDVNNKLERLKVLCRQKENAGPLFEKSGLKTVCHFGFNYKEPDGSREALRCLANALLLEESTRETAGGLDCHTKATTRLKDADVDDEFLLSRILVLMTYEPSIDFSRLVEECHLAESINARMIQHAASYQPMGSRKPPSVMHDMALCESLKLLFNVTHHHPSLSKKFHDSLKPVLTILRNRETSNPPLDPPTNFLINALINLDILQDTDDDIQERSPFFPEADLSTYTNNLIIKLDSAMKFYKEMELDNSVTPLLTLLRKTYEISPSEVKRSMQKTLLPSDADRLKPLGRSDALASRLLQLSNSALAPSFRDNLTCLLFELSDKDATQFIQNLGYGYASGFLMSHKIPIPEEFLGQQESEKSMLGVDKQGRPLNPITGQRLDQEEAINMPEMTDEEKEREAERLFVLFERLKKTGIIDIQNPVEKAKDEGRFEEIERHNDAVVIYDPQSRQLALQDSTRDLSPANCRLCGRPLHDDSSDTDLPQSSSTQSQPSFVNPEYFRMLHGSAPSSAEPSTPPSPRRRLAQPARSSPYASPASTPLRSFEIADDPEPVDSPQSPHVGPGISAASLSQGYFARFFVVDRELGRGGKGVVLLVTHMLDGVSLGQFACKRIPVGDDHEWLEKVLFEVQLLQNLSHQNLVSYRHVWLEDAKVNNFGPSVPCAFILQQYCNSGDLLYHMCGTDAPVAATTARAQALKNRMRRRSKGQLDEPDLSDTGRTLSFDEIYSFFRDIASGLSYLHRKGYIHRDLKPSNCLLHNTGTEMRVLVSDFGEVQQEDALRRSTGTTGTISYCAPEVLQRIGPSGAFGNFTAKSDVFSLGMILYFMCFGRLPYSNADSVREEDEDIDQLREEIGRWSGFDDNTRVRKDLPQELYKFLKRLLSLNPAERPTAEEILHSISTGANGVGDSGPGISPAAPGNIFEKIRSDSPGSSSSYNSTRRHSATPGIARAGLSRLKTIIASPERMASVTREPSSPGSTSSSVILRPRPLLQDSATTPKLLPPPSFGRRTLDWRRVNLSLVIKSVLFIGKVMSLSQLCWPHRPHEWVWWPLLGVAILEFGYQDLNRVLVLALGVIHVAVCFGGAEFGDVCNTPKWVLGNE